MTYCFWINELWRKMQQSLTLSFFPVRESRNLNIYKSQVKESFGSKSDTMLPAEDRRGTSWSYMERLGIGVAFRLVFVRGVWGREAWKPGRRTFGIHCPLAVWLQAGSCTLGAHLLLCSMGMQFYVILNAAMGIKWESTYDILNLNHEIQPGAEGSAYTWEMHACMDGSVRSFRIRKGHAQVIIGRCWLLVGWSAPSIKLKQ